MQSTDTDDLNGTQAEGVNAQGAWLGQDDADSSVTSLQPLRNQSQEGADAFFDFDIEPDSPGSPIDECEYSRLIETTTHTPQPTDIAPESGYVCASPVSAEGSQASQSSSDGPYFDPETTETERSLVADFHDCVGSYQKEGVISAIFENVHNGALKMRSSNGDVHKARLPMTNGGSSLVADSEETESASSDSLPSSQSTTTITSYSSNGERSESTITAPISLSTSIVLDEASVVDTLENARNVVCKEQAIDEIRPGDLSALKDYITTNETSNGEALTNGHDETEENNTTTDEVDFRKQTEDEQIEIKNELIILECLRVIDATPEATPEPENRSNEEGSETEGQLKVEENVAEGDQDTDGDGMDDRPQRVRRCSSLKTGKTPPGTPGRKKIVRFADVLGLDLAAVRTFMDEMPKIPKSAYEDLDLPEPGALSVSLGPRVDKVLMPLFQQPAALGGFLDIIRDRHVSLENAAVTDPVTMTIAGSVRVRNLDFHKSVYIRYTTDSWRTYSDLQANYVENSCDGFSDKFTFTVFGNAMQVGERIEIAVRFHCKGQILWDNNYGSNYCFQCLPVSTPTRPAVSAPAEVQVDTWHGASFY